MTKSNNLLIRYSLAIVILCYSALSQAEWVLNNNDSNIHFVSIKNASIAEVHHFNNISGQLNKSGNVNISIDLNSVNTQIKIRDERMKEILFQTGLFPKATITTTIDAQQFEQLKPGENKTLPVSFQLDLHGMTKTLNTQIKVISLSGKKILVTTIKPLTLNLADYKLIDGINSLRKIAKLSSINTSVVITAHLVFAQ